MTIQRRTGILALGAVLLAACQLEPAKPANPAAPTGVIKRDTRPSATPEVKSEGATPTPAAATPTPTPTPTPQVPMRALSGTVRIDASYPIEAGLATLVSNNGSSLISINGGSVVAVGGGLLLSNHGGGLVANNGAGVVLNVGNLVSDKGTGYRTLAAPAPGTVLPVKGMVVVPVSLITGKPIGQPVLTDATGAYRLEVPEATSENVLIFASIPVASQDDPAFNDVRLRYGLVRAPQKAASGAIDEEVAQGTRFVARMLTERFFELLSTPPDGLDDYLSSPLVDNYLKNLGAAAPMVKASLREFYAEAVEAKVVGTSRAVRYAACQRVTDTLVARVDLAGLRIQPSFYDLTGLGYDAWEPTRAQLDANRPTLEYLERTFAFILERTAARMRSPEGLKTPYLAAFNEARAADGLPPYVLKRPSDLTDLMVNEYIAHTNTLEGTPQYREVLDQIDALQMPDTLYVQGVLRGAGLSVMMALQQAMILDPKIRDQAYAALQATP